MAEGEGKSFENPTYEPDPWDDDYGDEMTLRQLLANTLKK